MGSKANPGDTTVDQKSAYYPSGLSRCLVPITLMSSNAFQKNIDAAQLTERIREQLDRSSNSPLVHIAEERIDRPIAGQLLESIRSVDRELDSLASQLESGEPSPGQPNLRGRIGTLLKRRLYRLLWWQTQQIKALTALVMRQGQDELNAISELSERSTRQTADIRQLSQSIAECKRQIKESEERLRQLESAQLRLQAAEIERNVKGAAQLETTVASVRQEINDKLTEMRRELTQRIDGAVGQQQQETAQREQFADRLSELGLFTHQTRTALTLQERRLTLFIDEARKQLPEALSSDQVRQMVNQHDDHKYDSSYVAFEDVFRGSREEIKARQSIYLPLLEENGIGSVEMPILDVGCGRGEWLELLRERDLRASGVDRNERMVDHCISAGLQVIKSDVLLYLRTLPDASLGAVTSFHMVEHLPFETILALVDESLRVLRAGGFLILETPNPANILVGSYAFHFDPTHLKPLPGPMLRFFVESRGFCDVHIRELHPYPDSVRFPDDGKGMAKRLNDYLYGPQDYAVIGRKC